MLPTLEPGWFVLVNERATPEAGSVVLARHPDDPELLIVKRTDPFEGGQYWLSSDNPSEGSDSRSFGAVETSAIVGVVTLVLDKPRHVLSRPAEDQRPAP